MFERRVETFNVFPYVADLYLYLQKVVVALPHAFVIGLDHVVIHALL